MVLVVLIFCQLSVTIVLVCYAALTPIQYESLPLIGVMIVIAVNKQDHHQKGHWQPAPAFTVHFIRVTHFNFLYRLQVP